MVPNRNQFCSVIKESLRTVRGGENRNKGNARAGPARNSKRGPIGCKGSYAWKTDFARDFIISSFGCYDIRTITSILSSAKHRTIFAKNGRTDQFKSIVQPNLPSDRFRIAGVAKLRTNFVQPSPSSLGIMLATIRLVD